LFHATGKPVATARSRIEIDLPSSEFIKLIICVQRPAVPTSVPRQAFFDPHGISFKKKRSGG
jgi:hypothetical protein